MSLVRTLQFILRHPLNRGRKTAALLRYLRWQVGARLVPGPVAITLVNDVRLLVTPGMTGATGNVYCGLHEFEDMAFVLHLLRAGDLMVDVGANVGSYSLLAAAAGARCITFEPVPSTFGRLEDNIRMNGLTDRIDARRLAIGSAAGTVAFTVNQDTTNHVRFAAEVHPAALDVEVQTLDEALGADPPTLIKIDVEGFEAEVLRGAARTLQQPGLLAVILELNGSGQRYGSDDAAVHRVMLDGGFVPWRYDPRSRELHQLPAWNREGGNTIYGRDQARVQARLQAAERYAGPCWEI